jgi:hypothetical protein
MVTISFSTFTDIHKAKNRVILKGLLISFGQSTKSPFTFFYASAGAACSIEAFVVTLIASGAASAFIRSIYIVY